MNEVTGLITIVDVDGIPDATHLAVSARHEAALADGRRVLLLGDRGWSTSGPPDVWARTSVEDVVVTSRMVVGPDEPPDHLSREDMDVAHWTELSSTLFRQGIVITAGQLKHLPHQVVLSGRLRALLVTTE